MMENIPIDQIRRLLIQFIDKTLENLLDVKHRNTKGRKIGQNIKLIVDQQVHCSIEGQSQHRIRKGIIS